MREVIRLLMGIIAICIALTSPSVFLECNRVDVNTAEVDSSVVTVIIDNIKDGEEEVVAEDQDESLIRSIETTRDPYYDIIAAYHKGNDITYRYYRAIEKYSNEYNLSVEMVSALIAKECSFDIAATHAIVTVKTRTGKVTTRAIGAGIIYELWDKDLKDVNINSKKDLRSIENNVRATCYILKILRGRRRVRGTASLEQSMILRYYGIVRRDGVVDTTYYKDITGIVTRYSSE